MVSYKDIVKLEKEMDELSRKIIRLESDMSNYESQLRGAQTRSNVGLSTMPLNTSLGLSIKIMGDADKSRIKGNISDIETKLTKYKDDYTRLKIQLKELKRQWQEERKEAELVVEGNQIYVKGDPYKRDVLEGVKIARQDMEDKLRKLEESPIVSEYITSQNDLHELIKGSQYETQQSKTLTNSKFYDDIRKVAKATNLELYTIVDGYVLPDHDFSKEAAREIERRIDDKTAQIHQINMEFEAINPTLLQRIFKSSFQKKKKEIEISNFYKIQKINEEIAQLQEAKVSLDKLEKEFLSGYSPKMEKAIARFKKAEREIKYSENDIFDRIDFVREKLDYHNVLPDIRSIISSELKTYLLETNQSLSVATLVEAIEKVDGLAPEIEGELSRVLGSKNARVYEPVVTRRHI